MNVIGIIWLCAFIFTDGTSAEFNYDSYVGGKIIGGEIALEGSKKFMASFRYKGRHFCSAFLITNRKVMTAAQCLKAFLEYPDIPSFEEYSVVIGNSITSDGEHSYHIEDVEVLNKYNHNETDPIYDIGVITLMVEVNRSISINWIDLSPQQPYFDLAAEISGWGFNTRQFPARKVVLKTIIVQLYTAETCHLNSRSPIFCAIPIHMHEKLSEGDTGSPLIQGNKVIGVVSVPNKVGDCGVHTRIDKIFKMVDVLRILRKATRKGMNSVPRKRAYYKWAKNFN